MRINVCNGLYLRLWIVHGSLMESLDKIIKERRGLLSSLELHAHLAENPHKWVGFECFLGADGERQWKVLIIG